MVSNRVVLRHWTVGACWTLIRMRTADNGDWPAAPTPSLLQLTFNFLLQSLEELGHVPVTVHGYCPGSRGEKRVLEPR
jgi:hypothetical protein